MSRTAARYRLTIEGLPEAPGAIRCATLFRLLDGLRKTAERATRLVVTGAGARAGPLPGWLRAATDLGITDLGITGLHAGSTVVELAAPTLGAVAREQFGSGSLWAEPPDLDDTALDLASCAIAEVVDSDASGDLFDQAVLAAARDFAGAASEVQASCRLDAANRNRAPLVVMASTLEAITERMAEIPAPRTRRVTGMLDEIGHHKGQFRLRVAAGATLRGEVPRAGFDVEQLRGLWGREATVSGRIPWVDLGAEVPVHQDEALVGLAREHRAGEADIGEHRFQRLALLPGVAAEVPGIGAQVARPDMPERLDPAPRHRRESRSVIKIVFHNPPPSLRHLRGKTLHWDGGDWSIPDAAFEADTPEIVREWTLNDLRILSEIVSDSSQIPLVRIFTGDHLIHGALHRWGGEVLNTPFDPRMDY